MFFKTKDLIVKKFTTSDSKTFHKICNNHFVTKWMDDWKMDFNQVCDLLQYFIGSYEVNNPRENSIAMAVRLKENNRLIGMCGFGAKEEIGGDVEICYFIDENYSGKGYMSQVVTAAIKYYFEVYNEAYLCALVDEQNTASRKILINNSFKLMQTNENPHYRLYQNDIKGKI